MSDKCYIYGLRSKDLSRYFYVGSTKHSLEWRWKKHKEQILSGRNRNLHFVRTVKLIGFDNIVIETIEEVDRAHRFHRESYWIESLPGLTNLYENPLSWSGSLYSADYVENKWQESKDRIDPRFTGPIKRLVESTVKTLRVVEYELQQRGISLEFSA